MFRPCAMRDGHHQLRYSNRLALEPDLRPVSVSVGLVRCVRPIGPAFAAVSMHEIVKQAAHWFALPFDYVHRLSVAHTPVVSVAESSGLGDVFAAIDGAEIDMLGGYVARALPAVVADRHEVQPPLPLPVVQRAETGKSVLKPVAVWEGTRLSPAATVSHCLRLRVGVDHGRGCSQHRPATCFEYNRRLG